MTETSNNKNFRIFFRAMLALSPLLASLPARAAENYIHSFAPATPPLLNLPNFGLSSPTLGGETRIPAARPPAAGPAYAHAGDPAGPQGRLRLRPANFGGGGGL